MSRLQRSPLLQERVVLMLVVVLLLAALSWMWTEQGSDMTR